MIYTSLLVQSARAKVAFWEAQNRIVGRWYRKLLCLGQAKWSRILVNERPAEADRLKWDCFTSNIKED